MRSTVELVNVDLKEYGATDSLKGEKEGLPVSRPCKIFNVDFLCLTLRRWGIMQCLKTQCIGTGQEDLPESFACKCCYLLSTDIRLVIVRKAVLVWGP